ncbi:MAG: PKD domain-containing protein, partial [Thermoanaerobaculia bacterium]
MRRLPNGWVGRALVGAAVLAVLVTACSVETPTAPVQTPAPVIIAVTANFTCTATFRTVQFFDLSAGNPTSWSWTFGDGGKSNKQSPTHTYKLPLLGDYLVT